MKSRWARASTTRTRRVVARSLGDDPAPVDGERRARGARHRDGAEDERPRRGDREAPPHRHAGEHRGVDEVVAPEVQDRAMRGLQVLEPGELAVAPVEDRVDEEGEGARELPNRRRREEERRRAEADRHADHRDRVRGDRGAHQPPRDGERDAALHVARHEALAGLDQAPEEPRLGGRDRGGSQGERPVPVERVARGNSQSSPRAATVASAVPARAAAATTRPDLHLDHRDGPVAEVEPIGLEWHPVQPVEPAGSRHDVVRHENDPARQAGRDSRPRRGRRLDGALRAERRVARRPTSTR